MWYRVCIRVYGYQLLRQLRRNNTRCSSFMSYHYDDVIMDTIASLITSLTIVYSTVYSDADQRTHQSSASLAFVWGIHRGPVNSPHKWPVTRKMFQFDDVIMSYMVFDTGMPGSLCFEFEMQLGPRINGLIVRVIHEWLLMFLPVLLTLFHAVIIAHLHDNC